MSFELACGLAQAQEPASQADQAQGVTPRQFSIPAQPLGSALMQFAQQSGWQVSAHGDLVQGKTSPGVSGTMTPEQAIARLLAGTGLNASVTGANTVTVTRIGGGLPGVMQLDPVQVQGYPVPPQAMIDNIPPPYAGGQVATGGQVGLLGNRDVQDTPFNQTSYTAKKAQDQQARSVRDVLIDDPSVKVMSADRSVDGENMRIRGFEVFSSSIAYGGLYGLLPFSAVMVELAERIEVLKGPGAMLNGIQPGGNIGGIVNVVPKRASNDLTQVTAAYYSSAQFGGAVDVARRFGPDKEFGARFNGVYRAGETAVQWNTDQDVMAVLGLDFRGVHARLSADLGYQYQYIGGVIPGAQLAAGVSLPWAPDASKTFAQAWNRKENRDLFGVIRAEFDLTDRVTAYAAFGAHDNRANMLWAVNALINNVNGNATSTPVAQGNYSTVLTGEVGLRGFVDTGPIVHELALNATAFQQDSGAAFAIGTPFTTNIFNAVQVPIANLALPPVNKTSTTKPTSLALADTLSAADKRIQLTVGARWQNVASANFNPTTGLQTSSYDESAVSPSVSLVFKPWRNVSVYGNWIQGLQPGTIVGPQFANAGEIFPPFKSTQYEVGIKVDWSKFTTTISAFQITQPSILTNVANNTQFLGGEQRNRGLEFNFFGEPLPGVRLLGGAMFLDAILTKTQGDLTNGWQAPSSPGVQLRLAGEWDLPFARGFTVDGRFVYTGSQYIDTLYPRRSIPEWTRFDIGARYTFDNVTSPTGKPVVLRFNVENVFDTNYWMAVNWVGAPLTFRASLTADF